MKYNLLILILFTSVTCFAQGRPNFNQGGATVKNYYIEFPYQMVNGKILVDVEIAGAKHKFILDTGAPTCVSATLAKQIKAAVIGKADIQDIGGKSDSMVFVRLDKLSLGGVPFSGIPALGAIPDFLNCFQAEGIIGSNLLRGSIIGFRSDKHMLVISDQFDKFMLDKKYAAPMAVDSVQSWTQIAVNFNGLLGTIPFDTGMRDFMNFREEWIKALQDKKIAFEIADKGFGSSVIGALGQQPNEQKYLIKFPAVQIGNARFENLYTETTKDGTPIIGTKLLDYGNLILDYINKQYYFFPKTATINVDEKHWPLAVTVKEGKMIISMVWDKGKELAQLGEQVLSIDGKDYTHAEICEMATSGSPLAGKTTATLVVKDTKGKKRTVQISKQ